MAVHILVVDDEEDLGALLRGKFRSRLNNGEWVLHFAKDGVEALDVLNREPDISLVLTDLNMPRMDGLTLLEHIQNDARQLQAVVVSAYGDMENIRVAMNRGAFDFVVKPINLADLEATIEKTLDHVAFLEEAKATRDALTTARMELNLSRELERLKSQFFANISHEFRTPLTLIVGPLQDVLRGDLGELPARTRERLALVYDHAGRLGKLIDQLLDVSRLEAGKLSLSVQERDMVSFVDTRVRAFLPAAERAGVTLTTRHMRDVLPVWFDAGHLEKIISNLLSNALKWTPAGGRVRVETGCKAPAEAAEPMAYIQVRDNGAGIEPGALPHIFDRYYRADASSSAPVGTGIGLALTKELVALHGGKMNVDSEPGFGATFTVHLPLGNAHLDPALCEEAAPADAQNDEADDDVFDDPLWEGMPETAEGVPGVTVLVVEDNDAVRSYVCDSLVRSYRVLWAENGKAALEILASETPALIISDVMMPEMDGLAFCKAVKANPALQHIPVVLLTARAEEEDRLEGLGAGADDYIVKPFNARELLTRAENLIAIRKMLQRKYAGGYVMQVSEVSVPSADEAFLESIREAIEANMGDPDFDIPRLADAVALSPRQVRRKIKALTGVSVSGLVRSMRLQRAAQLLTQEAGSVAEIAYQVGFHQPKYFSRLFKQVYGVSPSAYA